MQTLDQLAPFIPMFVVLYFPMIRLQMKRQKQEKNLIQSMKKGGKVTTKGDVHGRIVELIDDTRVIETLSGKIMFERSAISMELSAKLKTTENKDYKKT